jgi:hypothetical protein
LIRRFSSRRAPRIAVGSLLAVTLVLVGLSRSVIPTGLSAPSAIPPIEDTYTAQISGFLDVPPDRRIGLAAPGAARLILDGRPIARVESRGLQYGELPVTPGVHRVIVQFEPVQDGETPTVYLKAPGAVSTPAPPSTLSPRRLPPEAWMLRRVLHPFGLALALAWMLLGAAYGLTVFRAWFIRQLPTSRDSRRAAWAMLAFSLVIFAYPFWWGVPVSWSQDEVWPVNVRELMETLTPGWSSRYPPLHIYVVALANSPILAASALDLLDATTGVMFSIMKAVTHLVSVAMAVGTAALLYVCASRAAGHRAGVLAGLFWSLTLPAVFYAKTANLDVPYTFWFALALLLYTRALAHASVRLYTGFAVAGTLAIVTKDQAYGLFVLPALHLAFARARHLGGRFRGVPALARDPAILLALVSGVVVFAAAHNLPFNWTGFRDHVETITGGASEGYRMVDSGSGAGQAWLAVRTVQLLAWSHTWPGVILAGIGVAIAMRGPEDRRKLLPFLLPAVSYYVTFIAVIGYTYDRFMIPMSVIAALFAGVALDRLWPPGAARWRAVATAGLLLFMSVRTVSINLLMAADGRYEVRRWMQANIPEETRIGVVESSELLPNMWHFSPRFVQYPVDEFAGLQPPVAVFSDNYRRRYPGNEPEGRWHDEMVNGTKGYRVVFRHQAHVPLSILRWERQFRRPDPSFSALHKVNPEITVLFRDDWRPE